MWKDADRRREPTCTSPRPQEPTGERSGMAHRDAIVGMETMILGIETSCDETAAAVVTADGQVLSSIVASQAELHARYGGVVPEVASRRHLELVGPVVREALDEAGVELGRSRADRRHAGPGPDRCAARRPLGGQGDRLVARHAARPRRSPAGPRGVALPRRRPRSSRRSSACSRAAGTRSCSPCASAARSSASAPRSTTPPARRSTRAPGCSACRYPGRRRDRRARARGRPRGVLASRSRASRASTSRSPASRRRSSTRSAISATRSSPRGGPTSPRPTSGRSCAPSTQRLARGGREPRDRAASPSSAALRRTRELRAALPGAALAPLALCTDNAAMIASAARFVDPVPAAEALEPGCVCVGCLSDRGSAACSARRSSSAARRCSCVGGASGAADEPASAAGWESLLGDRPSAQLGGRWIVVLAKPSLATRVAAAGGVATEEQERAWTAAARAAQQRRDRAARIPRRSDRARARLLPRVQRLRRPRSTPAALAIVARDPDVARRLPGARCHPRRGRPGPCRRHLRRRCWASAGCRHPGILRRGRDGRAARHRRRPRPSLHPRRAAARARRARSWRRRERAPESRPRPAGPSATAPRWLGSSSGREGPAGSPASLPARRCCRSASPAGSRTPRAASPSTAAPISCSPGIELAVDPERGRRRPRRRPRRARRGRRAVCRLHRRPARRGRCGCRRARLARRRRRPATTGRPAPRTAASAAQAGLLPRSRPVRSTRDGGAPPATCCSSPASACSSRAIQPLGGVVAPSLSVSAPVVALARAAPAVVGAAGGLTRLFDTSGYSRVGGAAALLPRGTSSPEAVREVVAAGARAVLVDGPLPAGVARHRRPSRRADPRAVRRSTPRPCARALRRAIPVTLAVGAAAFDPNAALGDAAPFSSEGLAFDGGPKPEVSAAGIGLATSDPGRNEDGAARYGTLSGSSAAAALTAGAAALLAQARPDLDAAGLKQALVASSRRTGGAAAGRVDPSGAAAVELVADPPTVGLGVALAENADVGRIVTLRNVSRRALELDDRAGNGRCGRHRRST